MREELCEIKKYYSSISECFKELQDIILHTKVEAKKMLEREYVTVLSQPQG